MATVIQVLLSCTDINTMSIKSSLFVPKIGEKVKCRVCGKEVEIIKVGNPYEIREAKKDHSE